MFVVNESHVRPDCVEKVKQHIPCKDEPVLRKTSYDWQSGEDWEYNECSKCGVTWLDFENGKLLKEIKD